MAQPGSTDASPPGLQNRDVEAAARYGALADEAQARGDARAELRARLAGIQALEHLGASGKASQQANRLLELASEIGDPQAEALARASVGRLLVGAGSGAPAREQLERARTLARDGEQQALLAAVENDLANLDAAHGDLSAALGHAAASVAAARAASRADLEAVARANLARLELEALQAPRWSEAPRADSPGAARALAQLERAHRLAQEGGKPTGQSALLLRLSIANSYITLTRYTESAKPDISSRARALLDASLASALEAGDHRAASYAHGYAAELEASEGRIPAARVRNDRALREAAQLDAPELTFRWLRQRGALLAAAGERALAIDAYRRAVALAPGLGPRAMRGYQGDRPLRDDLAGAHRELVGLLLEEAPPAHEAGARVAHRHEARDVIERSRAAELRDYFRDDCVDQAREAHTRVDEVASNAAVLYPIILRDRLELLLTLPGGELRRFRSPTGGARLTRDVRELRSLLEKRTTRQYLRPAQRLYAALITPIAQTLASASVETLVVVPDGPLRTIPFAALHDGERFLIERHAIAVTPGIDLTDPAPLPQRDVRGLYAGLSESVAGMPALDHVPTELEQARAHIDGPVLLDRDFRISALDASIESRSYRLIHIATHGEFRADPAESYLLAWNGRLLMDDLGAQVSRYRHRQEPLDLLILSACETASGSDRAALGLAGMAVRAGARSVLGTLWDVNDAATAALVDSFYAHIQGQAAKVNGPAATPRSSRAVALQRAQISLLESPGHGHPGYWAPFVLVGSWL
jgi:CHAT domain-containing protein